eukprot:9156488-Pyramimonas_sp.AAC.1
MSVRHVSTHAIGPCATCLRTIGPYATFLCAMGACYLGRGVEDERHLQRGDPGRVQVAHQAPCR